MRLVKCYECEEEVGTEDAELIKFGFKELFELNEAMGLGNSLAGLEELGDFYVCNRCSARHARIIADTLRDLNEERG